MSRGVQSELDPGLLSRCCDRCGKSIGAGGFEFRARRRQTSQEGDGPVGQITKCFACALKHPPMLKRSLAAAVVVGTVLTVLNQGDVVVSGQWDNALYWKIPLTFCVPFVVATYGALTNSRK